MQRKMFPKATRKLTKMTGMLPKRQKVNELTESNKCDKKKLLKLPEKCLKLTKMLPKVPDS